MAEQAIQALSLVFSKTLAPDKAIIQQAELELKTLTAQPGYSFTLLQLVAAPAVDAAVRQAAAVSFKNLIKYRWAPSDSDVYSGAQALPDSEKAQIKATLPNLMLGTPPLIQAQLSEALSIICAHDFPRNWPTLLPELVQKLEAGGDVATISGVLATANSIFKRYRNQYSSDAMVQELAGSQEVFAPALLKTQMMLSAQLPQTVDPTALRTLLSSVRLVFRIFFSLNAPGLTPLVEGQLDQWMAEFHTYLALPDNPALAEADPEKESALDAVRGAACQNINLDNLAMSAIRFLTTVSKSVHHKLFADAATLQQICESIVIPNLRLREDDQEAMLAEYAASPATNWKSKDAAIYLVLALTVKGKTASHGATSTNEFVNIQDFFGMQILPELQPPISAGQPILKADAIKFVTTFRSLLPKETLLAVFPLLVALLASEYNVVHSYAAIAIEKLLSVKDMGQTRLTPADLQSQLAVLFERLFAGFKLPESSENEYLMRAVTRVIGFVGPAVAPVAPVALQELARMLLEVCKNPRNPGFNHYLFESVAALIRHVGSGNPTMIDTFEQLLFPAFNHVLQQDVQEFHPYVFQVFSQLIELRTPPLPAVYLQIFPPLLHPQFWERSGNVPALVRLLQAYLAKAPAEVVSGGHLVAVLGVFQKLLASKAHDHEGFLILGSVVDNLPLTAYEQYLPTIFTLLFSRLQQSRTHKFVRSFMAFLAQFIIKHGPPVTLTSVDKVQPGVFMMLLQQVWLPNLLTLDGANEVKMALVASGKCLTELPPLQADAQTWTSLKEAAYKKLGGKDALAAGPVSPLEEEVDFEEAQGYTAAYAKLSNAAPTPKPVLPEIPDVKVYLDAALASVGAPR
ncbi:cellular apoptosis susceptibility/chromosome segregation 1-like protein [Dunaliella salina]|uniref:Cellular apoptosis susceptibility/chromosome segregation 1-like protein n=2 Tax=Dunaliella salina TaxID=3046 RepID=A0ABQ7GN53_DUNSA|nr:cellular apoptosis susceptibility/chromosome segregation 1-like protein [Dunaliella salina]|eukprot:KAF5835999.1 cellular apoptosis susceptibility/chromosome segregation 1-like protein [Dunaliella salina]